MKPYKIEFIIDKDDFYQVFGREPDSEDEFRKFCELSKTGLNAQIDWNVVFNCAKEAVIDNKK